MAGSFLCFGIGIMICNPMGEQRPVSVVNSFCNVYQRVIRSTEEGAAFATMPRTVRERTAANDTLYRCQCEHWDNPICQSNGAQAHATAQAHAYVSAHVAPSVVRRRH